MQYTNSDYEFLGKQVAAGRYVTLSTFTLALVLALLAGMCLGRYVFPYQEDLVADGGQKRPLTQGSNIVSQTSNEKQLLQSIFQHEEDVRKDPANVEAWEHLGNLYFDVGEPEKAINAYNKALELKPGNTGVLVDCGVMYRQTKQFDKALDYFQQALKINPKHETALFNSGIVLYFDLGRKEDAFKSWRELVKINPDAKAPTGQPVAKMLEELK